MSPSTPAAKALTAPVSARARPRSQAFVGVGAGEAGVGRSAPGAGSADCAVVPVALPSGAALGNSAASADPPSKPKTLKRDVAPAAGAVGTEDNSGRVGEAPEGGASGWAESSVGFRWRLFQYSWTQGSTGALTYSGGAGGAGSALPLPGTRSNTLTAARA